MAQFIGTGYYEKTIEPYLRLMYPPFIKNIDTLSGKFGYYFADPDEKYIFIVNIWSDRQNEFNIQVTGFALTYNLAESISRRIANLMPFTLEFVVLDFFDENDILSSHFDANLPGIRDN